jgi:hypothetical protein
MHMVSLTGSLVGRFEERANHCTCTAQQKMLACLLSYSLHMARA